MVSQATWSIFLRSALLTVALCLGIFIGARYTGLAEAASQTSELQAFTQRPAADAGGMPNAADGVIRITCPPNSVSMSVIDNGYGDVAIWSAGCPGAGPIEYWQFSGDLRKANHILAITLSAQARGRAVNIFYDPNDTSGLADPLYRRKIVGLGLDQ